MKTGDIVEDFSAKNQHGESTSLSDLVATGPVVVYFYPKAMTPG